ncbi:MAG: hypothetical protein IJ781_03520 [Atopobiaceae bacterium]|nr:hypothetical protein [Atopobiaceae bacterium]
MREWTEEQDDVIRERRHEGAAAVRDAIWEACGVSRTVRAVEARASRLHVSLKVERQCPECGAIGVHINRQSGMCALCTERGHVAEERAYRELLKLEAAGCDSGPELDAARREYARLRKANSRLSRAHGLRSKQERDADGSL